MPDHMNGGPVWLIGTGSIAREYVKVLRGLRIPFIAVGRSEESTKRFIADTGAQAVSGGLEAFLRTEPPAPPLAVNAVQAELGSGCIRALLAYGVQKIFAEKPAGMSYEEVRGTADLAKRRGARVAVGYNRRFYASTLAAQSIIARDGGVTSFHFEFTELHKVIAAAEGDVSGWFFGNSTHVCDLAFHLGGTPREMSCYGRRDAEGYTSTVVFAGAGVSETGALFSYQANYLAPGRWGVEALTPRHRLIFRPMERLQVQELGSFSIEPYEIDDSLDREYKPGMFLELCAFIENPADPRLLSLERQADHMALYTRMHEAGYGG